MGRFQAKPHRDEAIQALREGIDKFEVMRRFGISLRTADRYIEEIQHPKPPKEEKFQAPPSEPVKPQASRSSSSTAKPVTTLEPAIVAKPPSTFVFEFEQELVKGSKYDLENAYRYYREIQELDPEIDDPFYLACCGAMKHVWTHVKQRVAMQIGEAILQEEEQHDGVETRG